MKPDSELPEDVVQAIQRNRKIDAIKLLRDHRGLGLKQAKQIIDDHVQRNPTASARRDKPGPKEDSGLGRLILVGLLAVAVVIVYQFFFT